MSFYILIVADLAVLQSLISTKSRLVISPSGSDVSSDSVLCSDAMCIEVPTDDIRLGDSVLVLPGETIPVDVSDSPFSFLAAFRTLIYLTISVSFFDCALLYVQFPQRFARCSSL